MISSISSAVLRTSKITKVQHPTTCARKRPIATGLWAGLAVVTLAGLANAEEKIIKSHGFSNFGTLKYDADFKHLDYVNPDAPKGGEISQAVAGTFDTMNPYSRKGVAPAESALPYESLMQDASLSSSFPIADDAYGAYCLLCETIEYPESQDWVIFNLRPEAKFSDGTPVTAEDVVFTVELFLEQGLPSYAQAVKKLYKSVEALDKHRVKFTFHDGIPRKDLILQAASSPVFPKAWFEKTGARLDQTLLKGWPGSGAYVIDQVDPGRRITLKRNPDYWGADLPINKGRFNFDTIRQEYFLDPTAAFEAFKSGQTTFRAESSTLKWATSYNFPAFKKGYVVREALPSGALPPATGIIFNLRQDKFKDIRVRQALALMFNFTWTNETLQYGSMEQRSSFWQDSELAASGVPEGRELELLKSLGDLIDPAILSEPVVEPHESGKRQLDRRNLRKASALLQEAGWESGAGGKLKKDGKTLDVEFLSRSPTYDRIFQPYVENLKRLGVNARYNRVDLAQYANRRRGGDWDVTYHYYLNHLEEAQGLSQRYGSEDAEYSLFNPSGYHSEAVDRLIEEVTKSETFEDMSAAVRAIDRVLRKEQFLVPTWYKPESWVAFFDMYSHPETLPPYALGVYDFWWYDADKAAALKAAGALK